MTELPIAPAVEIFARKGSAVGADDGNAMRGERMGGIHFMLSPAA